jgi:hypothetical protein
LKWHKHFPFNISSEYIYGKRKLPCVDAAVAHLTYRVRSDKNIFECGHTRMDERMNGWDSEK